VVDPPDATVDPWNSAKVVGPVNWIQNCAVTEVVPKFVNVVETPGKPDTVVEVGSPLPEDWNVLGIVTGGEIVNLSVATPTLPLVSVAYTLTVLLPLTMVTGNEKKAAPVELVDVIGVDTFAAPFRLYLKLTMNVLEVYAGDLTANPAIVWVAMVEPVVVGAVMVMIGRSLTM